MQYSEAFGPTRSEWHSPAVCSVQHRKKERKTVSKKEASKKEKGREKKRKRRRTHTYISLNELIEHKCRKKEKKTVKLEDMAAYTSLPAKSIRTVMTMW
jgi:hypothetical protein